MKTDFKFEGVCYPPEETLKQLNELADRALMITIKRLSDALGCDITQRTRKGDVPTARFVAWRWLYKRGLTVVQIGALFGMNHSTVSYGLKQADMYLTTGDQLVVGLWNRIKDLEG